MVRDCPECYNDGLIAGAEAMAEVLEEYGSREKAVGIDLVERARITALNEIYPATSKPAASKPKPKPKPTARNKAYSKAFKSVQGEFKKKNGSWKKNGFKNCSKKANGMCK